MNKMCELPLQIWIIEKNLVVELVKTSSPCHLMSFACSRIVRILSFVSELLFQESQLLVITSNRQNDFTLLTDIKAE